MFWKRVPKRPYNFYTGEQRAVPELPDASAVFNPIWSITATATLKIQGRGRRWGIQIGSFCSSFPGLWVAQPITQLDLVKCLSGPMKLEFLATAQSRFRHLPPLLSVRPRSQACANKARCAACGSEPWEMGAEDSGSPEPQGELNSGYVPPASPLSLRGCAVGTANSSPGFQKEWGGHASVCVIRNGLICIWRKN